MSHKDRWALLAWAVYNLNAVPTGGATLKLYGKVAEFGPKPR